MTHPEGQVVWTNKEGRNQVQVRAVSLKPREWRVLKNRSHLTRWEMENILTKSSNLRARLPPLWLTSAKVRTIKHPTLHTVQCSLAPTRRGNAWLTVEIWLQVPLVVSLRNRWVSWYKDTMSNALQRWPRMAGVWKSSGEPDHSSSTSKEPHTLFSKQI